MDESYHTVKYSDNRLYLTAEENFGEGGLAFRAVYTVVCEMAY